MPRIPAFVSDFLLQGLNGLLLGRLAPGGFVGQEGELHVAIAHLAERLYERADRIAGTRDPGRSRAGHRLRQHIEAAQRDAHFVYGNGVSRSHARFAFEHR